MGASAPEGGLWDPNLDAPTFLENTLLSAQAKEKLESLEKDQLVKQAVRQLGQALAANCLAISQLRGWKGSAKEESHKVSELSQQVGGLRQETEELQRLQQEAKALLTEKSKEVLEISNKNADLQVEVERLNVEVAKRGKELAQKDKKLEKVNEALTTHIWQVLRTLSPKLRGSTLKWISPNLVWARPW